LIEVYTPFQVKFEKVEVEMEFGAAIAASNTAWGERYKCRIG
jgi:hypothetical protein